MSTFQESLSQWAKFEPDCCRDCHGVQSLLVDSRFCVIAEEPTETDFAHLLGCLFAAIVRQGLRVEMKNNAEEWSVGLWHPDVAYWSTISIGTIDEAAPTRLAAYVRWLEKKQEVQSHESI